MKNSFWQQLPRPIIGLSPMDGITDSPFRFITKKYGQPDVMYTEFTSVEGVCHGAKQLLKDFLFDESQRPIIAQLYGTTPKFFRQVAVVVAELGFDGIDINMGCPAKNVAHAGAGASLIKTPDLAQEIIRQTQAGIEDWVNGKTSADCPDISPQIVAEVQIRHLASHRPLPVSVKTRIGYDSNVIEQWLPVLLETGLDAIAIHGRTLKQQYHGEVDWSAIATAAKLVHQTETLILGNGNVQSLADAQEKIALYGLDGILLGRAALGNPAVFQTQPVLADSPAHFAIALEHAQLYEKTFGQDPKYNFLPMRKHLGWYIHDIPHAAQIRQEIYQLNDSAGFAQILAKYQLA